MFRKQSKSQHGETLEQTHTQKKALFETFVRVEMEDYLQKAPMVYVRFTDDHQVRIVAPKTPLEIKGFGVHSVPSSSKIIDITFRFNPLTNQLVAPMPEIAKVFINTYPDLYAILQEAAKDAVQMVDHPELVQEELEGAKKIDINALREAIYGEVSDTASQLIESKEAPYSQVKVKIDPQQDRVYVEYPLSAKETFISALDVTLNTGTVHLMEVPAKVNRLPEKHERKQYKHFMHSLQVSLENAYAEFVKKQGYFVEWRFSKQKDDGRKSHSKKSP